MEERLKNFLAFFKLVPEVFMTSSILAFHLFLPAKLGHPHNRDNYFHSHTSSKHVLDVNKDGGRNLLIPIFNANLGTL